jgi:hypothetical protein
VKERYWKWLSIPVVKVLVEYEAPTEGRIRLPVSQPEAVVEYAAVMPGAAKEAVMGVRLGRHPGLMTVALLKFQDRSLRVCAAACGGRVRASRAKRIER